MIGQIIFCVLLIATGVVFGKRIMSIRRNILLGRDLDRTDKKAERWKTMAKVALGQSKMVARPFAGIMHVLVYLGFVIINIEVAEIVLDGILGTHRLFAPFLGGLYDFLIGSFEILALLVLLACVVFFVRRNIGKIKRFSGKEMTSWPKNDANIILITEILLMTAFLTMNGADKALQAIGADHYIQAGSFPVSGFIASMFSGMSEASLIMIERGCWWFHIIGILGFLVYIPYSKHLHIFLGFPNTFYSNLEPKGQFTNMDSVTAEVKAMLDPSAPPPPADAPIERFGAKDATDLTWKNLMDAYSCTECGRCTSQCPANQTGKLLSPRKIMMDTRDRLEEIGANIDKHGKDHDDGKSLVHDFIAPEELWACTTCNACTDACPINIDPLNIIVDLRRYLVMEEAKSPADLNNMFSNVENNGAPWPFSPADRLKWADK
ncbi:MAG: heterodisulfide reductase subunit C [Sphingobacteriales bacterium]|jgi:heterodisulfide reductase subunit C